MHYLISGTGAFQFLKPSPAYAADESVHDTTRHDIGTTRIHTRDRGSELERKEANGRPADQPRIRLRVLAYHKSCRSCTTGQEREVSHTDAVLPFASVIGRAYGNSVSRISNPIAISTYTCKRARKPDLDEGPEAFACGKLVDSAFALSSDRFFRQVSTGG